MELIPSQNMSIPRTQFIFARRSTDSSSPSISIKLSFFLLSISFIPHIDLTIALSVLLKIAQNCKSSYNILKPTLFILPSPVVQVVLCFSPVGNTLRVRGRKFPAVTNCTCIDWFHEWPQEALVSVSQRFLEDTELLDVSIGIEYPYMQYHL